MRWKPNITIRENHIQDRIGIQISDPISMKRLLVSKDKILDLIFDLNNKNTSSLIDVLIDQNILSENWDSLNNLVSGIKHWDDRNWKLATAYYLWARRDQFLDEGENYEEIRCKALDEMLKESEVPLPPFISDLEKIDLGKALPIPPNMSIGGVLENRRTSQIFNSKNPMSCETFAGILEYGFSVSRKYHIPDIQEHIHNLLHGVGFAFDPYIAVYNIEGLEPGIYYYNISQNKLRLETKGDFKNIVSKALIGHNQALTSVCTIFLVVDFRRFQWRYRHERALRNLYVDAGRMAQYLILIATAYGLKNHLTPATRDSIFSELLNIDFERRQVFYGITLGY